jgi:spore coat polysaccharide biosynthesis protein SpsF
MKTVAIIQARMGSERLHGKALLRLPFKHGKTSIEWIIDQLKTIKSIDKIVLATSVLPEDDPLIEAVSHSNIETYRGDEKDVLKRFYHAALTTQADHIVRITGDNPILALEELQTVLEMHQEQRFDYTSSQGLPLGMNVEVFTFSALERAHKNATKRGDREHVTTYLKREEAFKKGTMSYAMIPVFSRIRMTMDYPSDYAFFNLLFSAFESLPSFEKVLQFIDQEPWIAEINRNNSQIQPE